LDGKLITRIIVHVLSLGANCGKIPDAHEVYSTCAEYFAFYRTRIIRRIRKHNFSLKMIFIQYPWEKSAVQPSLHDLKFEAERMKSATENPDAGTQKNNTSSLSRFSHLQVP
jgi:hypothetical protein